MNSKKKKVKWIKFPKGTTRKQKAQRLQAERAKLGLPPWKPSEKSSNKQPHNESLIVRHSGHTQLLVRGQWGPHTAKYICADCDGAFVKWCSTKPSTERKKRTCT